MTAFTLKDIKAGFAASGLFRFNLDRVLRSMPMPPVTPAVPRADEMTVRSCRQDVELQIPETQKFVKAYQTSSTQVILKDDRIQLLTTINNEAKV